MLKIILLLASINPVESCEYQSRTRDFDAINQEQFTACLQEHNYSKQEIETIIYE